MDCRVLTADDPLVLAGTAAVGCVYCPTLPALPSQPAMVQRHPVFAWDAGAHSVALRGGNCYTEFEVGDATGVIVGFCADGAPVTVPASIDFGFYVANLGPARLYQVMERGLPVSAATEYDSGTRFRIERWGSEVRYLVDGDVVHVSVRRSDGAIRVGARLYGSGDAIP